METCNVTCTDLFTLSCVRLRNREQGEEVTETLEKVQIHNRRFLFVQEILCLHAASVLLLLTMLAPYSELTISDVTSIFSWQYTASYMIIVAIITLITANLA